MCAPGLAAPPLETRPSSVDAPSQVSVFTAAHSGLQTKEGYVLLTADPGSADGKAASRRHCYSRFSPPIDGYLLLTSCARRPSSATLQGTVPYLRSRHVEPWRYGDMAALMHIFGDLASR